MRKWDICFLDGPTTYGMNLKQSLESVLGPQAGLVKNSFDVIGSVAVIEIPDELVRKQQLIARTMLARYPNLKTVCKKAGERSGEFRLRRLVKIAGNGTKTIHKEHGYQLALDVQKAYFSPRESTERQRIAAQVRPRERVLVMFAGIGPFCIAIAKKQSRVRVIGIESNPQAVKFFEENVKINKVRDTVVPLLGDVRKAALPFIGKCDRVVMPLPTEAHRFLPLAFRCLKKGGIIHFYSVGERNSPFEEPTKKFVAAAKKAGTTFTILHQQSVLPFGPGKTKVCLDVKIR